MQFDHKLEENQRWFKNQNRIQDDGTWSTPVFSATSQEPSIFTALQRADGTSGKVVASIFKFMHLSYKQMK